MLLRTTTKCCILLSWCQAAKIIDFGSCLGPDASKTETRILDFWARAGRNLDILAPVSLGISISINLSIYVEMLIYGSNY